MSFQSQIVLTCFICFISTILQTNGLIEVLADVLLNNKHTNKRILFVRFCEYTVFMANTVNSQVQH